MIAARPPPLPTPGGASAWRAAGEPASGHMAVIVQNPKGLVVFLVEPTGHVVPLRDQPTNSFGSIARGRLSPVRTSARARVSHRAELCAGRADRHARGQNLRDGIDRRFRQQSAYSVSEDDNVTGDCCKKRSSIVAICAND